jgi:hypothetical protein
MPVYIMTLNVMTLNVVTLNVVTLRNDNLQNDTSFNKYNSVMNLLVITLSLTVVIYAQELKRKSPSWRKLAQKG